MTRPFCLYGRGKEVAANASFLLPAQERRPGFPMRRREGGDDPRKGLWSQGERPLIFWRGPCPTRRWPRPRVLCPPRRTPFGARGENGTRGATPAPGVAVRRSFEHVNPPHLGEIALFELFQAR